MQLSDLPTLVPLPFANSGTKNVIPLPSQIGITAGAASLTTGFPPLTFTSIAAGGVPPSGADFNGILNLITSNTRWDNAGGFYPYDSTFSTEIGGYPKGSILSRVDATGFWLSTADNNTLDPETDTSGAWVPINNDGATTLTLSTSNVTLTALEYAKDTIVLTGTLLANVQIIFPATIPYKKWTIVNNTTGAFTITCKTSAGTGVSVSAFDTQSIYCDGTNIKYDSASIGQVQSANLITGADSGVANAYALSLSPAIPAYEPGMFIAIENIIATNTGASTIAVNGLAALPIYSARDIALQGDELSTGYSALFRINKDATAALLVYTSGGPTPVATATKGAHAVNLAKLQAYAPLYSNNSGLALTGTNTVTVPPITPITAPSSGIILVTGIMNLGSEDTAGNIASLSVSGSTVDSTTSTLTKCFTYAAPITSGQSLTASITGTTSTVGYNLYISMLFIPNPGT